MCLGVPGRVITIDDADPNTDAGMTMGTVEFGGIRKQVCLACVPEVEVGDYVMVHAGFAIERLDEEAARETLDLFRQIAEAAEADG